MHQYKVTFWFKIGGSSLLECPPLTRGKGEGGNKLTLKLIKKINLDICVGGEIL
jgi:hypothetical protein